MRLGLAALVAGGLAAAGPAAAADFDALYDAYWAGLPAAHIQLGEQDTATGYRGEIKIRAEGLAALVTHFRGSAATEGRFAANRAPAPIRYDSLYDLRKRRHRHLSMHFNARAGAVYADRGPDDTSRKPPLAEAFRRNVVDPISALAAIRSVLRIRPHGTFTIAVYDGARRFDVLARVLPDGGKGTLHLALTLRPIAGFKGESSDDGDPDTAPRNVDLRLTDDDRLMPLSMSVPLYLLPLVVEFARVCTPDKPCGG